MNKLTYQKFNLNLVRIDRVGFISFILGSFLLFSAPIIASFFLLVSIFVGFFLQKKKFFYDKFNLFLIFISALMVLSCFLFPISDKSSIYDNNYEFFTNPYIGLINWIPLFMSFWGFQLFLDTNKKRQLCAISLICGTIPLLISGYTQYFLNWYGPYEILNGLIIWFQRNHPEGSLTSVFNNPNYAGCIFSAIWPFFYVAFRNSKINLTSKIILLILNFLLIYATLLTSSRNAFISLIIVAVILSIPFKKRYLIISSSSLLITFIFNSFLNDLFKFKFLPSFLFKKLEFHSIFNDPRILIWKNSLLYVSKKPLLGWGGHNFSYIWNQKNAEYIGHSHSIPLELSIQYGIFTALAITGMIFCLLILSFRKLFISSNSKFVNFDAKDNIDRAWFASTFSIIFSNLIDIQYFDLRVSILIWMLLAGLKNIIATKNFCFVDTFKNN